MRVYTRIICLYKRVNAISVYLEHILNTNTQLNKNDHE